MKILLLKIHNNIDYNHFINEYFFNENEIFIINKIKNCNNKKIKGFTNWKPKYSLTDGLIETIKWNIKTYSKNKITKKYII